jgi:two-component system cell cycle sensor histidine kinase/response regulator CckA
MESRTIRQKAEALLREKSLETDLLSPQDLSEILHELQVHQVELELQNEELRRIQTELQATQSKYFDLFNLAPVGYFSFDEHGTIIELNLTGTQLLGRERKYLIGRPILSHFSPESRPIFFQHLDAVFSAGTRQQCELNIVPPQKSEQPAIIARVDSVAVKEGNTWLCRSTMIDISRQKALETEALKVEKLESEGLLAGGIAHDFNNILTGILGNIGLVQMQLETEKIDSSILEMLQQAEEASLRAKELTFELLTFARGGNPIKETISIDALLHQSSRFVLRGSNVRPQINIKEKLWAVEVDQGQIYQVLNNLLINADQAMPNGGNITITAQNKRLKATDNLPLPAGKYICITIQDDGMGIPKTYLSKIFDPYFTTKQKGSGLGLATAYTIIQKHNGHISITSEPGKGSIFTIYLPASKKLPLAVTSATTSVLPAAGYGHILVIDDDEIVTDLLSRVLKNLGYKSQTAPDGETGLKLYQQAQANGNQFNLVITDLTIPGGMGGKEVIKKLQEIDPQVKAIVSSGYSNDPVMANYQQYGFRGVLTKPYQIGKLSKLLQHILDEE